LEAPALHGAAFSANRMHKAIAVWPIKAVLGSSDFLKGRIVSWLLLEL
jgi:hypothetical protein